MTERPASAFSSIARTHWHGSLLTLSLLFATPRLDEEGAIIELQALAAQQR
jgi:hypothetical protein